MGLQRVANYDDSDAFTERTHGGTSAASLTDDSAESISDDEAASEMAAGWLESTSADTPEEESVAAVGADLCFWQQPIVRVV